MSKITRRQFVKRTTAAGAACTIGFPSLLRAQGLNEKLQVGFIAVGGRAGAHTGAGPRPLLEAHHAGIRGLIGLCFRPRSPFRPRQDPSGKISVARCPGTIEWY